MAKELCFNYKAKTRAKELVSGVIYAEAQDIAFQKVKNLGYTPVDVPTLNIPLSINAMIYSDFNKKELMIFYKTMGKRMGQGRSTVEGLETAVSYIKDPRLKQALMMAKNFLSEGMSFANALKLAGFPLRDVEILRSTADAGEQPATLLRLAAELDRNLKLEASIKSTLKTPILMFLIMYLTTYGLIIKIAPKMMDFFKILRIDFISGKGTENLPSFIPAYYKFAAAFNQNVLIYSIFYFGLVVAFVFFLRSKIVKKSLDYIPVIRNISVKTDLSNLWSSFGLLYDSGANIEEVCKMMSKSARREEHSANFLDMARLVRSGIPINKAVQKAGFPDFVIREVNAAQTSGSISEGLIDMSEGFAMDVEDMTDNLKSFISLASLIFMTIFVLLFFMISYYPSMATIMSKL